MSKFEDAVRRSCLEWACALPDGTEYTLSENSESYFKKLIKRMEHGSYYRISKKTLRFILIAALIAALCTAVTIGANIGEQDFEIIPNGDMAQYKVIEPNSPIFKSDLEVRYIIPGFEVSKKCMIWIIILLVTNIVCRMIPYLILLIVQMPTAQYILILNTV